jgi:hypothetical protein
MRKTLMLIVMFGLLVLRLPAEAVELTVVYSNDTRGWIDPCPT